MNIKRIVFASLFCIAVLLCAGKKAEAAFPYDMEQKPVTATSCLLYTSPSPRDRQKSRMPSSA